MQIVIGWKSHSTTSKPELIYLGNDGVEAQAAIAAVAGRGFIRAKRFVNPSGAPVRLPDERAVAAETISKPKSKKA